LANALIGFITDVHYLLALWPLLALLAGFGAGHMAAARLRPVVLLVIWMMAGLLSVFNLVPNENIAANPLDPTLHLPWDRAAEQMRVYGQPGDTLIDFLPEPVPNWLHFSVADYYLHDLPLRVELVDSPPGKVEAMYRQEAETIVTAAPRLWIARQPDDPPLPAVDEAFGRVLAERNYLACGTVYDTPDLRLSLYASAPGREPDARFGDGITAQVMGALPAVAETRLPVLLNWAIPEGFPSHQYSAGLHIDNPAGQLVAQSDYALPAGPATCVPAFVDVSGLPPGEYRLMLMVYAWETGARLTGLLMATGETADRLLIGTFRIADR
jgi:hypothetical protein